MLVNTNNDLIIISVVLFVVIAPAPLSGWTQDWRRLKKPQLMNVMKMVSLF